MLQESATRFLNGAILNARVKEWYSDETCDIKMKIGDILKVLTSISTFIFNYTIPLVMTFTALDKTSEELINNQSEIDIRCIQWATLGVLMFFEPYIRPVLEMIPGGSLIITLLYLWVFSPYFNFGEILYQYVFHPMLSSNVTVNSVYGIIDQHIGNIQGTYEDLVTKL